MQRALYWTILSLPAFIFASAGYIYLWDGISVNASFPIPLHLRIGEIASRSAYQAAAKSLLGANPGNGDAQISQAESEFHATGDAKRAMSLVKQGLSESPASVEGWAFYAELLAPSDPKKSAQALHISYMVSPNDFYVMPRRCKVAASIWPTLAEDDRAAAVREARRLWSNPSLRPALVSLTGTPAGRQLVTRAWAQDPQQIRAINRWISAQDRQQVGRIR